MNRKSSMIPLPMRRDTRAQWVALAVAALWALAAWRIG